MLQINGIEVLSVMETAVRLNVSVVWVYDLIKRKQLTEVLHGKKKFVSKESIERYEENKRGD